MKLAKTPLLVYLTVVNLIIYIDRGTVASLISELKDPARGLGLSEEEAGLLGSGFMFGFMVTCPLFAHLAQYSTISVMTFVGLGIWILGNVLACAAESFAVILIARILTGVGEAPICPLIPPVIMDIAPARSKSVGVTQVWLGLYFAMMPMGQAFGYLYGEYTMEALGSWRWPFLLEGGL